MRNRDNKRSADLSDGGDGAKQSGRKILINKKFVKKDIKWSRGLLSAEYFLYRKFLPTLLLLNLCWWLQLKPEQIYNYCAQ